MKKENADLFEELKNMAEEFEPIMKTAEKMHKEIMKKDIMKMSKKELMELENFYPVKYFNGVVIVPMKENHDSDFSCMKFILLKNYDIVGVVSGWSDVIHLNGIGGYGEHLAEMDSPKNHSWSIDCLPKSKCVRLFTGENLKTEGFIGSDFIIYACGKED